VIAAEAHLSGAGPVCEACHRSSAAKERERNAARESNVSALLGGVFAALAGAWLVVTALGGVVFVKASLIAVGVLVSAVATVPRMRTSAAHGTLGKILVALGAAVGAGGLVALIARFAG
jgi:predicted lipid-binding transport protein (Tim44 family)